MRPPERCETPAAPPTPALWAAPWHSSSASSSRCTCAGPSGARGVRPSRDARRGPAGRRRDHNVGMEMRIWQPTSWTRLTLYDCSRSRKRLSFSTTSSFSRLPWGRFPRQHLLAQDSRAGGGDGGVGGYTCWAALSDSTANSTDRLFRDWRRVPQVAWEEAQGGRGEPSEPNKLQETTRLSDGRRAVGRHAHRPITHLSSLPNISRSVAFSLERSAIFSALSRSLLKLLWIFLINSRLVENWPWMSAGRYSYQRERQLSTGNSLWFSISARQTLAWVAILLVMNSSPVLL